MQNIFSKIAHHYRDLPNKKPYIEFLTALLTIPVLLTVITLNLNTLKSKEKEPEAKTTVTTEKIYVTVPAEQTSKINPTSEPCTPGVGPVEISSPEENETISDNPVIVDINYQKGSYCEVVWSYRINGGKWSDYDDKSIALYNPPQGDIKFDLRIKSIVNSETDSLTRNFIYKGTEIVPTEAVASTSAN